MNCAYICVSPAEMRSHRESDHAGVPTSNRGGFTRVHKTFHRCLLCGKFKMCREGIFENHLVRFHQMTVKQYSRMLEERRVEAELSGGKKISFNFVSRHVNLHFQKFEPRWTGENLQKFCKLTNVITA